MSSDVLMMMLLMMMMLMMMTAMLMTSMTTMPMLMMLRILVPRERVVLMLVANEPESRTQGTTSSSWAHGTSIPQAPPSRSQALPYRVGLNSKPHTNLEPHNVGT